MTNGSHALRRRGLVEAHDRGSAGSPETRSRWLSFPYL
jgi:hypothetical protein